MIQHRTVHLPEDLCAEADKWLNGRFDSLDALVEFLLREVLKDDGSVLDQREEEIVQQRLRDLGYI